MRKLILIIFAVFVFSGLEMIVPKESEAACRCVCVNGQKQNLCSSTLDIPRSCFGLCPMKNLSLKPLKPLKLKPLGTTSCSMKQVWNSYLNRYQWKRVCR